MRGYTARFRYFLFAIILLSASGVFSQTGGSADYSAADNHSVAGNRAVEIARGLDDNALAAQVLLAGIDGKTTLAPAMRTLLERIPAGGIMLFKYNLDTSKDDVKKLLAETSALVAARAGIAPFMAADHEGGLVHRFGPGVARLPSAFSFWELAQNEGIDTALSRAKTLYRRSAAEIRELGITMVLGPVAETLDSDNRLFLDTRSYGPDAAFTEAAASVFIESMAASGIASAAKHFPGNSAADPHSGLSTLYAGKAVLDEMVRPFAGIIRNLNIPALMLSHVLVPALDSQKNSSLSGKVIRGWLRGELGFEGVVIADDFSMGAVASSGLSPAAASVEALNAGVDMIMVWPTDLSGVHAAVLDALKTERLLRERLLEAASRVIEAKLRCGIIPMEEKP